LAFSDRTHRLLAYSVVCSVMLCSVMLCILAQQEVSEHVNRKCRRGTERYNFQSSTPTLCPQVSTPKFPTQCKECIRYVAYIMLTWRTCRSCDTFYITFNWSKLLLQYDRLSQQPLVFL